MKRFFILFVLLYALSLSAQKGNNTYFTQKEWLERAQKFQAASDFPNTMNAYYFAYVENPKSEEGKEALQQSDSIKNLLRKKIIKDIQGNWILEKSGSNWGFQQANDSITKTLTIRGNSAAFFEIDRKSGNRTMVKSERLIFTDLDTEYYHALELIDVNNVIWRFTVKDNSVLHIMQIGEAKNNVVNLMVCGNSEYFYKRPIN